MDSGTPNQAQGTPTPMPKPPSDVGSPLSALDASLVRARAHTSALGRMDMEGVPRDLQEAFQRYQEVESLTDIASLNPDLKPTSALVKVIITPLSGEGLDARDFHLDPRSSVEVHQLFLSRMCDYIHGKCHSADGASQFERIVPEGRASIELVRNRELFTQQYSVLIDPDAEVVTWFRAMLLKGGFHTWVTSGVQLSIAKFAVAVPRRKGGAQVSPARVIDMLVKQSGLLFGVFWDTREYPDKVIYAFVATDAQVATIATAGGFTLFGAEKFVPFPWAPASVRGEFYVYGGGSSTVSLSHYLLPELAAKMMCKPHDLTVFKCPGDAVNRGFSVYGITYPETIDTYDAVYELCALRVFKFR
jgi:hypothetical protein